MAGQIDDTERDARVDDLLARVPRGADILELGCGAGGPTTQRLAAHGRLTGVDISAEQLRRARERIPAATFIHGDAAAVELPDGAFDAVVSLYALNNLPREELGALFRRIHGWLRPRRRCSWRRWPPRISRPGRATGSGSRCSSAAGTPTRRCGSPMRPVWRSSTSRVEAMQEPEGEVRWLWLLAIRR